LNNFIIFILNFSGIWHISGLIHSLNKNRRRVGDELISTAHRRLTAKGNSEDALMLIDSQKLFPELVELAALQLKERKLKWRMSVRMDLKRFLVPTQGALKARVQYTPHSTPHNSQSNLKTQSNGGMSGVSANSSFVTGAKMDTSHYPDPCQVYI
jgi:hypothetical protein